MSWETVLSTDICEKGTQWCSKFPVLNQIRIPRFIFLSRDIINVEIHCFFDASQKTYGVIVYLRVQEYNEISVNLVASKTRIALVKKITLPRLELLEVVLAARLG